MLEMLSAKTSLTTCGIVQQEMILWPHLYLDWLARDVVRKNFTEALWNCATRDDPKKKHAGRTASLHANDQFHWLTRCSCGWVVCMLEMLSAKTSLTTCGIVQQEMILWPHLYLDWLARDVVRKNFTDALWNCATRDDPKKKHAGRTASLHANDQFHWLTRCSCGWVVCMLEMLSAKTSLTTCGIVQQEMILWPHLYLDWLVVVVL